MYVKLVKSVFSRTGQPDYDINCSNFEFEQNFTLLTSNLLNGHCVPLNCTTHIDKNIQRNKTFYNYL